jgi:hypothetical protein
MVELIVGGSWLLLAIGGFALRVSIGSDPKRWAFMKSNAQEVRKVA